MFDRDGADLVLLDLMLPGPASTDVRQGLRQRSNAPVIMLTGPVLARAPARFW